MRKIWRKIFLGIGLAVTGIIVLLVYTVNEMICRPVLASAGRLSDSDFTELAAKTEDGIDIHAIHYQGVPGAGTVVLCHGHGVNLKRMDDLVGFLRRAGYGLLLADFRAHGQSGGTYCTIGLHEWKDLRAVLDAARAKGLIDAGTAIAAYGRSMGAATLINGAENLPEIKAFILESSFERLRSIAARDAWHHLKIPDTFLIDVAFWLTKKMTGIDYASNAPEQKTRGISNRAVFLIHDEKDARADLHAFNSLKNRLPQAQTWVVKDAWHVCAHHQSPVEFEMRFLNFLHQSGVPGRP
ncbi:MAG: alpha/beta hydrolase [Candidatus Riflebacteria bacterium]|jgi:alpha-beta hydrolase superfamily lysophospholipase|nr:alpha/beta hydrolase [Candidatus Riflebacteria bacterium]